MAKSTAAANVTTTITVQGGDGEAEGGIGNAVQLPWANSQVVSLTRTVPALLLTRTPPNSTAAAELSS
jgi:hypothetical protein